MTGDDAFADVQAANDAYVGQFRLAGLDGRAAKGLAVLTCMDTRIDPLAMLGLAPGDAKILRNAGARVTGDVLDTLVLAVHLLAVNRIMIVPHTRCRMAGGSEDGVHAAIRAAGGPDTRSIAFLTTADADAQQEALRGDVQRVRSSPYVSDVTVGGFLYDVDDGRLRRVC